MDHVYRHANSASFTSLRDIQPSSNSGFNGVLSPTDNSTSMMAPSRPRSRSDAPVALHDRLGTFLDFHTSYPTSEALPSHKSSASSGSVSNGLDHNDKNGQQITPPPQSRFFPSRVLSTLEESQEEDNAINASPSSLRQSDASSYSNLDESVTRQAFESKPNELAPPCSVSSNSSRFDHHIRHESMDIRDSSTPGGVPLSPVALQSYGESVGNASSHSSGQSYSLYKPPHMRQSVVSHPSLHVNTLSTMNDPFISDPFSAPPLGAQRGTNANIFGRISHDTSSSTPTTEQIGSNMAQLPQRQNELQRRREPQLQESYEPCLNQLPQKVAEFLRVLFVTANPPIHPSLVNDREWSLRGLLQDAQTMIHTRMQLGSEECRIRSRVIVAFIMAGYAEPYGMLPPQEGDPLQHKTVEELKDLRQLRQQQQRASEAKRAQAALPVLDPPALGKCPIHAHLTSLGSPGYDELWKYFPFRDLCKISRPITRGIVRISNIPYNTTKQEVIAFLGQKARLVHQGRTRVSGYYAIHIIMERTSAKSMDCYVELETQADAVAATARWRVPHKPGRQPRIGKRAVHVNVAQPEELMMQLFPRANCVQWAGVDPVVISSQDPYEPAFKGFIQIEEMHNLARLAERVNRRAHHKFALDHPQRIYENMISTLHKYPWAKTELYTIEERDLLFTTSCSLLLNLREAVQNEVDQRLSMELLEELLTAALIAPGFSERQLAELTDTVHGFIRDVPVHVASVARAVPFDALRRVHCAGPDLMLYYDGVLKEAAPTVNLARMPPMTAAAWEMRKTIPFGNVAVQWRPNEKLKGTDSMAALIGTEMQIVDEHLKVFSGRQ